jgi:hypothetical protein
MEVLYNWFDTNGLVINTEKSITLSFHTWQNKIPLKPRIIFNNRDVNYSAETKFLGLHLDECLKWEVHIRYLSIKMNKSFCVLQSLKYVVYHRYKYLEEYVFCSFSFIYKVWYYFLGGIMGKAKKCLSFEKE